MPSTGVIKKRKQLLLLEICTWNIVYFGFEGDDLTGSVLSSNTCSSQSVFI